MIIELDSGTCLFVERWIDAEIDLFVDFSRENLTKTTRSLKSDYIFISSTMSRGEDSHKYWLNNSSASAPRSASLFFNNHDYYQFLSSKTLHQEQEHEKYF